MLPGALQTLACDPSLDSSQTARCMWQVASSTCMALQRDRLRLSAVLGKAAAARALSDADHTTRDASEAIRQELAAEFLGSEGRGVTSERNAGLVRIPSSQWLARP